MFNLQRLEAVAILERLKMLNRVRQEESKRVERVELPDEGATGVRIDF